MLDVGQVVEFLRVRFWCDGLPKDPALDLCRGVARLTGWRITEYYIQHAKQADNGIEAILALGFLTESVRDLFAKLIRQVHLAGARPTVHRSRVLGPI